MSLIRNMSICGLFLTLTSTNVLGDDLSKKESSNSSESQCITFSEAISSEENKAHDLHELAKEERDRDNEGKAIEYDRAGDDHDMNASRYEEETIPSGSSACVDMSGNPGFAPIRAFSSPHISFREIRGR